MDTQRGGIHQLADFPGDIILAEKQPDDLPVGRRRTGLLVRLGLFGEGVSSGLYSSIDAPETEAVRGSVGFARRRPRPCPRFRMWGA